MPQGDPKPSAELAAGTVRRCLTARSGPQRQQRKGTLRVQTPLERSLKARAAAHAKWSRTDAKEGSAAARRAFRTRFENQVDPGRTLPPGERARRADHAMWA